MTDMTRDQEEAAAQADFENYKRIYDNLPADMSESAKHEIATEQANDEKYAKKRLTVLDPAAWEAERLKYQQQLDDENYEPVRSREFRHSDAPCYWLVSYNSDHLSDLMGGGPVHRLVETRKEGFAATRARLISEYANPEDDDFREEEQIAQAEKDRAFLQTATIKQMREWLKKADESASIGMSRIQLGMEKWV